MAESTGAGNYERRMNSCISSTRVSYVSRVLLLTCVSFCDNKFCIEQDVRVSILIPCAYRLCRVYRFVVIGFVSGKVYVCRFSSFVYRCVD